MACGSAPMGDWQDWWFNLLSRSSFPQGPGPSHSGLRELLLMKERRIQKLLWRKMKRDQSSPTKGRFRIMALVHVLTVSHGNAVFVHSVG